MLNEQKINKEVKYSTRDRNPRRKHDYDYLRAISGRRCNDNVKFSASAKFRLFILLLIISMFPLFIALVIWGFK